MKEVRVQTLEQIRMVDRYDFGDVHREVSQSAGDMLITYAQMTANLEDEACTPADALVSVAQAVANKYTAILEDAEDTKFYLGVENKDSTKRIVPNVGSARSDFYARITKECEQCSLNHDDRSLVEQQAESMYQQMSDWLLEELDERVALFWQTTAALRSPDPAQLREESVIRAEEAFQSLINQIRKYGKRPLTGSVMYKGAEAIADHVPAVATRVYTPAMYDGQIQGLLDAYKVPDHSKMIAYGIQSGYVQAAKEAFGEQTAILDQGERSDPYELLDPYERKAGDHVPKRARLPIEFAKAMVQEYADHILYDELSPISRYLDEQGSASQKIVRTLRKKHILGNDSIIDEDTSVVRLDNTPIPLVNSFPTLEDFKLPEKLPENYMTEDTPYNKWLAMRMLGSLRFEHGELRSINDSPSIASDRYTQDMG